MFRGIYHHLIWALKGIYSRFVENVKIGKPTFSTRRHAIRMTAWTCAICKLCENLLAAASYSRRVSDLKVPIKPLPRSVRGKSGPCYESIRLQDSLTCPLGKNRHLKTPGRDALRRLMEGDLLNGTCAQELSTHLSAIVVSSKTPFSPTSRPTKNVRRDFIT